MSGVFSGRMCRALTVASILLALVAEPVSAAQDWASSHDRALLADLTGYPEVMRTSFERVGRWRFDAAVPGGELPLPSEVVAIARRKTGAAPERFDFWMSTDGWALFQESRSAGVARAFFWDHARQYAFLEQDGPEMGGQPWLRVMVVDHSEIKASPFLLHMSGHFLLLSGFPGDKTQVSPNESLLALLDEVAPEIQVDGASGSRVWSGEHRSVGAVHTVIRDYRVTFRESARGIALESIEFGYTKTSNRGTLMRRYTETRIQFGDGWGISEVEDRSKRQMQALVTYFDDSNAVSHSIYSEYRGLAPTEDQEPSQVNLLTVFERVRTRCPRALRVEVMDRAMGIWYWLGDRSVSVEGRRRRLDRPIETILSPASWVRLVEEQDWSSGR